MKTIRVAVVSADQLIRDFLRQTLPAAERRFRCVADLSCGEGTARECAQAAPELVIFDLNPGSARELAILRELADRPSWGLLVIAGSVPNYQLQTLVERRACGLLSRGSSLDALARAAFLVASGGNYFDPVHSPLLARAAASAAAPLSQRERHVLQLVAEGYTTKEVASLLGLSIKTVDKYRTAVMQKLDVHDVVRLTHCAIRLGLVRVS